MTLVGAVREEVGGFFPEILAKLQENPFLKMVSSFPLYYINIKGKPGKVKC